MIKMEAKIAKLQEVFDSMAYGESLENTSQANEWLQTIEIVDKSSDIDNLLKNVKVNFYTPKKQHLFRLAQELEKNANLIAQIEILSRGVLSKDTKKAVDILAQYFYYYASFVGKNENPKVATVGVFEDNHPLWVLGLFLAPALAAGHTVVLQTGTKFAAVVTYVLQLAKQVGVPEDALLLVPSNEGELQPYLSDKNVSIVALFVDLLKEKYRGINKFNKKILVFSGSKTPMLVFENADLDSAVESVIEAAWSYQGMLPWSINTILVQENIFQEFTGKLKDQLRSVKIGNGDDRQADISYPSDPNVIQRLHKTVDKARSLGIEVFQKENSSSNSFKPTLIIGSKVDTNNVLSAAENDSTVTLLAFRSIDEAVNLANNTRQGLGAAVWSENVGLVNEVARKLKVGNVWINSHGMFSPDLALVPVKDSGIGYFGGREGFYEYAHLKVPEIAPSSLELPAKFKAVEEVKSAISSGKNVSASWSRISPLNKLKIFQQLGDCIECSKKKFSEKLPESWLNNFIADIQSGVFEAWPQHTSTFNGYSVTSLKGPKGVVTIEMRSPLEKQNVRLLLAAILEGNAIILLNEPPETQDFYQEIAKKLPPGVLSVLRYSLDVVKTASLHKELNGYFSEESLIFGSTSLANSKIFGVATNQWGDVFSRISAVKNIWSNIGQSSQCNL